MHIKLLTIALALTFTQPAFAGRPYDDQMECPIGGESFPVTRTSSCSTMGRTLSLMPITSCDFITHLPQCPGNGLPVYKEFSSEDLAQLPGIIKSEGYQETLKKNRFELAYFIETKLTSNKASLGFHVLQEGLWREPELWERADYMKLYFERGETAIADMETADQGFYLGALAFAHYDLGDSNAAKKMLKRAMAAGDKANDYQQTYLAAVGSCIQKKSAKKICTRNSTIRDHSK